MKVYIVAALVHRFNEETREEFIKLINFVDEILRELNLSTYMTYRDFLQWGKVTYNPNTVFEKLVHELKTSNLVLAIHPHEGAGSNITLGIAAAFKKPLLIALDKNFDIDSRLGLMYRGFNQITKSEILVYKDLEDLRRKLRKAIKTFKS